MTITESNRKKMYDRLEATLGAEEAATLMEHLPPVGWADVARQSDMFVLRGDIERLHGDVDRLHGDVDRLHGDIGRLRSDMDRRFEQVDRRFEQVDRRFDEADERTGLRIESAVDRLGADLHRELRSFALAIVALNATITGVAVSLGRL